MLNICKDETTLAVGFVLKYFNKRKQDKNNFKK